jgi:hypothetical protein
VHAFPHVPQLRTSVFVLTHELPHTALVPSAQHVPWAQNPDGHTLPQMPQL